MRRGGLPWWKKALRGGLFGKERSGSPPDKGRWSRTIRDGSRDRGRTVVLAGNPNVGKSVFFTALSGVYREVSNYAGTTVDVRCARLGRDTLVDTPGVYGVGSAGEEERVARDVILSADIVINIVDAVHLTRDLFLTLQLIEMGIPLIVVLNMMDEAKRCGIAIDGEKLSHLLGVPVIAASGILGIGIDEVRESLDLARAGFVDAYMQGLLDEATADGRAQRDALLWLEEDALSYGQRVGRRRGRSADDVPSCGRCKDCKLPLPSLREEIYAHRRRRVNAVCREVVASRAHRTTLGAYLGRLAVAPISGMVMLCFVLAVLYLFIGVFVAQDVVDITEGFFATVYEPSVRALAAQYISADTVLFALLVGEYGLFTMTVTYLFGLILPLVAGFYLALSVLEDSGYLMRLAALVDRLMGAIGLNGRAVIPFILGFGCVTMATTATRLMGTERERTIVCALLGLVVPCSAQLGIITALMARLPSEYIAVYVGTMLGVFLIAGKMLSLLVGGRTSGLFIDLPPLRLVQANNVIRKVAVRTAHFLREGVPVFAGGAVFLTMLKEAGGLVLLGEMLAPVTEGVLHLPRETSSIFLMGMVRRDFAAAGLTDLALTDSQLTVALTVITLFVPCIATAFMMVKERGKSEGFAVWLGSFAAAFLVGGLLARWL